MNNCPSLSRAEFQAAVALAAQEGKQTAEELAARFGVTVNDVTAWHAQLLRSAASLFAHLDDALPALSQDSVLDSKELAHIIAENSTQGLTVMDSHGYCLYANQAWLDMTGYTTEEITSQPLYDLVHHHYPDGAPYPTEACPIDHAVPENFLTRAHEDVFFRKNGSKFNVSCAARPLYRNGKVFATIVEVRDITEQIRVRTEIEAERERLAHIFNTNLVGIIYWTLSGGIHDANDEFLRTVGYDRQDLQNGKIDWVRMTPEEYKEGDAKAVEELLSTGKHGLIEKEYVCKDGSRIWIAVTSAMLDKENGIGFVLDISKRKAAEARLLESEKRALEEARQHATARARLKALLEAAPVGIIMADADGKLRETNPANENIWGKPRQTHSVSHYEEWKGWWADGSDRHGKPVEAGEWGMARALRGEPFSRDILEVEPFDAPGVRKTIVNQAAPIKDDAGNVCGAVVAQMDISDRIRIETALREANRQKDEFLAMLAHELRNPLAPIVAAAELMERAAMNEAQLKRTSQVISRQVRHMRALVNDLLDVSRVTTGRIVLEESELDARHIVREAVEQATPLIEEKRHLLTIELDPVPSYVLGDQKRLIQALTNVLTNAARYTPQDGHIHVALQVADDQIKLKVTDDGMGIEPALQPFIFDLFTQGKRTIDRSQGGLGIGLPLVKKLVELHGGTVSCKSEGTHKGSQFVIVLPRMVKEVALPIQKEDVSQIDKSKLPLKILIVDDNSDAATTLASYLEIVGHTVQAEFSSGKGLERAKVDKPDVCILDIGLPEMDGNELARRLREHTETAQSILIALTGYGQEQDREKILASGFNHHLIKPVEASKIALLLEELSASKARPR